MKLSVLCFFLICLMSRPACAQPQNVTSESEGDLLIKNVIVVDGTGADRYDANILIEDGLIKKIGMFTISENFTGQIISLDGKIVSPGFIDSHSHGKPLETPRFDNFLAMGVTTITLGQDGSSPGMNHLTSWMNRVDEIGTGPNIIHFTGHNSLRAFVNAPRRSGISPELIVSMQNQLSNAISAGSFGLSTGLEYDHGRFSDQHELNEIARPVAASGGIVMSHMRNEDNDAIEHSIRELITQGQESGAAVHASHLKIVYANDPARADSVLALMNEARESGLQITGDVYPYTASYTGISILFPDFALPPNHYQSVVENQRDELAAYLRNRVNSRNGPEATLLGTASWAGQTLKDVADSLNKPFEDVLIDDIGPNGAGAAYFVMNEDVMKRLLTDPFIMVSSDGSPTMHHPRGYGSFAKIINDYVEQEGLLTLEEAIHKMSGLPARTLGLSDPSMVDTPRGIIKEGFAADLLIFDPKYVRDTATFENPHQLAEGFDWVFVNGVAVIENGDLNERLPGGVIRRR
jgi:N-acyl-D-aspartate/D-glutamate deacylase